MGNTIDLTGQKFGMLTVVRRGPNNKYRKAQWWCKCDCGNSELVLKIGSQLRNGMTKSCGCLARDLFTKKYNNYNLDGEYGIGYAINTNNEFFFDIDDYDLIKDYCWYEYTKDTGYRMLITYDKETKSMVTMSQLIVSKWCDHIDRNTLNNRRNNLRETTPLENSHNLSKRKDNISGVTGVYFNKETQKWCAMITVNHKRLWLGYFSNKDDAIKARLQAEAKYFGDYPSQRHLFDIYEVTFDCKG